MRPAFETVNRKRHSRRPFGQVRCIDLGQIAHANNLGARPGTCNQCFHLFGRQILRFIDDHVLVQKRTAAHEIHALYLDARTD